MTKSFISLLYEYSVQHQQVPVFEFFSENDLWKCLVSVLGEKKEGVSKTKKQAKQEAAKLMLLALNCNIDVDVNSVNSLEDNVNSVSALKEFCLSHKLKPPSFEIEDQSSSHAPLFIYKGTVSEISYEDRASSKKQAKRNCASGLLVKLQSCFTKDTLAVNDDDHLINDVALERLKKKGVRENHLKTKSEVKYPDLTLLFRSNFYPKSTTLEALKNNKLGSEDPSEVLYQIFKELRLSYDIKELPSLTYKLTSLSIRSYPEWTFIGIDKEIVLSKRNAEMRALTFLRTMCK